MALFVYWMLLNGKGLISRVLMRHAGVNKGMSDRNAYEFFQFSLKIRLVFYAEQKDNSIPSVFNEADRGVNAV